MKKFMAILVIAFFMLTVVGCGGKLAKVAQDIGLVAEKVCNFNVADSAKAQKARSFIGGVAGLVGLVISTVSVGGVKIEITQAKAEEIFDKVSEAGQKGGCVLLTDLQAALAYFDQVKNASESQAAPKMFGGVAPAMPVAPTVERLKAKAGM